MDWTAACAKNLLRKHGMQDSKPTGTPLDVNSKLQPATTKPDPVNQTEYQSAVGSLMYLAVSTRPDKILRLLCSKFCLLFFPEFPKNFAHYSFDHYLLFS